MKPALVAYTNGDDVLLRWTVDALAPGLRGFALQRALGAKTEWLDNYAPPGPAAHQDARHFSSDQWPFRSFWWTDHDVEPGDQPRYRVVPVFAGAPDETQASDWSTARVPDPASPTAAFFNRGFVISQFLSRYLDQHYPALTRDQALRKFKADISAELEDTIRTFLSGHLRTAAIEMTAGAGDVHAALFELDDEELIRALEALGPRLHVVLANGSITPRKGESSPQARTRDENADARKRLKAAGAEVIDRFVSPGALAHNKFLVAGDRAWTGSTNWTTTGLCTQLNNGLRIDDADVAAAYRAQWELLKAAGSTHPAQLAAGNGTAATAGRNSVHFTRAPKRADLAALREIVSGAREGVLFLMFVPGAGGVVADIRALAAAQPGVLLRGVVSELPNADASKVRVTLFGAGDDAARTYDVVQPEGRNGTAWWAAETTHKQFKQDVGFAIVHSKVLVIDPFSDDPTVVTGSHNFSVNASEDNDDNFIVVRGDRALAEAYAVNVENAWRHYATRVGTQHKGLSGVGYLQALLDEQRREEAFWRLSRNAAPAG